MCFLLPTLVKLCFNLYVCPTISLRNDMTRRLRDHMEKSESSVTVWSSENGIDTLPSNNCVVVVNIDFFCNTEFQSKLVGIVNDGRIKARVVIDEMHLLKQWFHFRENVFRSMFGVLGKLYGLQFVLLSATIEMDHLKFAIDSLNIDETKLRLVLCAQENFLKPKVMYKSNEMNSHRSCVTRAMTLVNKHLEKQSSGRMVVFCNTIAECNQFFEQMGERKASCQIYHGKLKEEQKLWRQNQFQNLDIKVMVATIAFSHGVDYDVENVLYLGVPEDLLTLAQCFGRVARGKNSNNVNRDYFVQVIWYNDNNVVDNAPLAVQQFLLNTACKRYLLANIWELSCGDVQSVQNNCHALKSCGEKVILCDTCETQAANVLYEPISLKRQRIDKELNSRNAKRVKYESITVGIRSMYDFCLDIARDRNCVCDLFQTFGYHICQCSTGCTRRKKEGLQDRCFKCLDIGHW